MMLLSPFWLSIFIIYPRTVYPHSTVWTYSNIYRLYLAPSIRHWHPHGQQVGNYGWHKQEQLDIQQEIRKWESIRPGTIHTVGQRQRVHACVCGFTTEGEPDFVSVEKMGTYMFFSSQMLCSQAVHSGEVKQTPTYKTVLLPVDLQIKINLSTKNALTM